MGNRGTAQDAEQAAARSAAQSVPQNTVRSAARSINGIVSAVVLCVFLVHATMGALTSGSSSGSWIPLLLWTGMALVGVHVVLCVVTSYEQLTDTVRPSSAAKKRHLVLKWITGVALIGVAAFHIVRVRELDWASAIHSPIGTAVTIALVAALAVHAWTGSKSLLKDLDIDRKYRNALRSVVTGVCVVLACALALSAVG